MALTFTVAYDTSVSSVTGMTPNIDIYAQDLGECAKCVSEVGSCWPCLSTDQQLFSDNNLTNPVADGYYLSILGEGEPVAVWHVIGGYPQQEGYLNPPM